MTDELKLKKLEKLEKIYQGFCEDFDITKEELLKTFGIDEIEYTYNWIALLMYLSEIILVDGKQYNLLMHFAESDYIMKNNSDEEMAKYSTLYMDGEDTELPKDLKNFFSTIGSTCPICGSLIYVDSNNRHCCSHCSFSVNL